MVFLRADDERCGHFRHALLLEQHPGQREAGRGGCKIPKPEGNARGLPAAAQDQTLPAPYRDEIHPQFLLYHLLQRHGLLYHV